MSILTILAACSCLAQTYNLKFGVVPSIYPPDTLINLHHKDMLGTWVVAPATGVIDTIYWIMGDTVGAKDSTTYMRPHNSRITPTYGPGVNFPPPPLPWGYFINTNDLDRGIAGYPEDATPSGLSTWHSTVPSDSLSKPPGMEYIWGYTGYGITFHAGQINAVALIDGGTTLDVPAGQAIFLSFRIKGPEMHVNDLPTQFRATHAYMPEPSHNWTFYEHDSMLGPGSIKGWSAVGGASANIWFNMRVTYPSSILIQTGWNFLSLTDDVANDSVIVNFPTASGSAFRYVAGKYEGGSVTLSHGGGYWLKFPAATTRNLGTALKSVDSVTVRRGWNMIGSLGPMFVPMIESSPAGIITSKFWSYDSSYAAASEIVPWRAYWVKVNQDGKLFMRAGGSLPFPLGKQLQSISDEMPPPPPANDAVSAPLPMVLNFALEQNYPNPFNPSTTIHYVLQDPAYVRVQVYNVAGQLVSKLVEDYQGSGEHAVHFDAGDLPSGIYYYELIAGRRTEVRKMVVVR